MYFLSYPFIIFQMEFLCWKWNVIGPKYVGSNNHGKKDVILHGMCLFAEEIINLLPAMYKVFRLFTNFCMNDLRKSQRLAGRR